MVTARYLPLPVSVQVRAANWWRRRAARSTCLVVATTALLVLLKHALYSSGDSGSALDEEDAELFDPSLDAGYVVFQPTIRLHSTAASTLKSSTELLAACLDAHITQGQLCHAGEEPRLDVVWTWVNGSDILLQDALVRVENSLTEDDPYRPTTSNQKLRQFREHDELRFSMRSALKSFRQSAGNFHLVTSDFGIYSAEPNATSAPIDWRLGQIPQWLNTHHPDWRDSDVKLSTIHHADIFYPYNDTIFNSVAIESQFGHLEGVSDNFVYMNDDLFFLHDLTQQSFYTSPYGLVLRMQSDLMVQPTPYDKGGSRGEWRGLAISNSLLSGRFGSRYRPYPSHEAKSSSISLLHEISQIWPSNIAAAATHPFRETQAGEGDLSMMFMMVHFVVERWREALLWSWVVGKYGGLDDSWGDEQTEQVWRELGGSSDRTERLLVKAGKRKTMEPDRVAENLKSVGVEGNDLTKYVFSSQDGYPYTGFTMAKNKWPDFVTEESGRQLRCFIEPSVCFVDQQGNPFTRASEFFKHIAFRKHHCGDCMITALVNASGDLGLSAFLPSRSRTLPPLGNTSAAVESNNIPHLPLVKKWEDGQFALRDVMSLSPTINVRDWTLGLLQRYRFVIGDTPSHFSMIKGPSEVTGLVRKLRTAEDITLLCINDDITREEARVSQMLQHWFSDMWPTPAAWEK